MLDQLSLLSKEDIDQVTKIRADEFRFHEIDWNHKNIPLKKSDINWLHKDISLEQLEICQIEISKAVGRLVGFFDDRSVFTILLLDPMHNIQPSKYTDYKVRPSGVLHNTHAILLNNLMHIHDEANQKCEAISCAIKNKIPKLIGVPTNQKYIPLNDAFVQDLDALYLHGKYDSVEYLLIDAIDSLMIKNGLKK